VWRFFSVSLGFREEESGVRVLTAGGKAREFGLRVYCSGFKV
jgi:hypothetical protein